MMRHMLWQPWVTLATLATVLAGPQQLPLTTCRSSDSTTLAPSDQLLNFTHAYVQLDQSQTARGQLNQGAGDRDDGPVMLRLVAPASTGSGSEGFSEDTGYLSTVVVSTRTLNFQEFTNSSALCNSISGGCPYDAGDLLFGLQIPVDGSYAFTDLTTKVTILDTSSPSNQLACFHFTATPYYPDYAPYKVILWTPVALALAYLVVTWVARLWTAYTLSMLNREAELASSLTTKLSANGIRERWAPVMWDLAAGINLQTSQPLRRFATPAARDVLWSIQFFAMLGMIGVQWPDFFYPVVGQTAWSSLAYNITLAQQPGQLHDNLLSASPTELSSNAQTSLSNPDSPIYLDESLPPVLLTIDGAQGLERFASVVGLNPKDLWPNAAAIFLILAGGVVLLSAAALAVAAIFARKGGTPPGVQPTKRISRHGTLDDIAGQLVHSKEDEDLPNRQAPSQPHHVDGINWVWHARMLCGNLLRLTLLFQLPIVIFSSFQIALLHPRTDTFPASPASVALAVLLLLFVTLFPFAALWRVHEHSIHDTAGELPPLLSYGPLYNAFGDRSYQFMLVRLAGVTISGVFVGALQGKPIVQVIIVLVIEVVETLTTALWLPYGENAAMGPLTFLFSVIRVITGVLLLIMTPTVNIGRATISWIAYVIMALHAFIFVVLFLILLVKVVELLVRSLGHAPFDESRSRRATGLSGAIRRWDRRGGGKMRRRATIERKSRERSQQQQERQQQHVPSMDAQRTQSRGYEAVGASVAQPHSPGFQAYEDDDGYIMAAMSGPRFGSHGYMPPGSYAAPTVGSAQSWHADPEPNAQQQQQQRSFSVVRGHRSRPTFPGPGPQAEARASNDFPHRRSMSSTDYFNNNPYSPPPDNTAPYRQRPRSYHAEIEFAGPPPTSPAPSLHPRLSTGPDLLSNSMGHQPMHPRHDQKKPKMMFGLLPRLGNRKHQSDGWSDDSDEEDDEEQQGGQHAGRHGGLFSFAGLRSLGRSRGPAPREEPQSEHDEAQPEETAQRSFKVVRKPQPTTPSPAATTTPPADEPASGTSSPPSRSASRLDTSTPSTDYRDAPETPKGISASLARPPAL